MREKSCLTFTISNIPLLTRNGRRHVIWEYPEESAQDLQKWVEKKDHVKCLGPLPKKPKIYIAKYRGGKNLKIYDTNGDRQQTADCLVSTHFVFAGPNMQMEEVDATLFCGTPIKKSAWEVFLKLAWLEDLHVAMTAIVPELDDEETKSCLDFIELIDSPRILIEHFPDRVEKAFDLLGAKATAIDHPTLRKLYKAVHHAAKYSANKKEALLMRKLLQRAFPKPEQHRARKIPIPYDQRILLAYELMKELTLSFHKKCKGILNNYGYEIEKILAIISKDEKQFAAVLHSINDARIKNMNPETIKYLVLSPITDFLDPQIANLYKCSPGALRKHLRQIHNH